MWTWTAAAKESPRLQSAAVSKVRKWMTDCNPPVMLHRDAPWGHAPIDALPVELHYVVGQAEPVKHAFASKRPELICEWRMQYLPLLQLPWCARI